VSQIDAALLALRWNEDHTEHVTTEEIEYKREKTFVAVHLSCCHIT
jgi:hypothetical protein